MPNNYKVETELINCRFLFLVNTTTTLLPRSSLHQSLVIAGLKSKPSVDLLAFLMTYILLIHFRIILTLAA